MLVDSAFKNFEYNRNWPTIHLCWNIVCWMCHWNVIRKRGDRIYSLIAWNMNMSSAQISTNFVEYEIYECWMLNVWPLKYEPWEPFKLTARWVLVNDTTHTHTHPVFFSAFSSFQYYVTDCVKVVFGPKPAARQLIVHTWAIPRLPAAMHVVSFWRLVVAPPMRHFSCCAIW